MKKIVCVVSVIVLIATCSFILSSCAKENAEIAIKLIDTKLYARFKSDAPDSIGSGYLPPHYPISFQAYERGAEKCISRSNHYARFMLTFNNTPDGYSAIDIFEINYLTVDSSYYPNRPVLSRAGSKSNEIEVIIYVQNYTSSETQHTIKSVNYTAFDSILGENITKTFDLNYTFMTEEILNFINRFDNSTHFTATRITTEGSNTQLAFSIDTNLEYDGILYNTNKEGHYIYQADYTAIESEQVLYKSDLYRYESSQTYYFGTRFIIVGFVLDEVKYYINPISFVMWDNN